MPNNSTPTPAELSRIAVDVAVEAAKVAAHHRDFLLSHGSIAQVATTKSSPVDPVTAVDKAVEKRIVDELEKRRGDDAIFGEEGANKPGTTGVTWVADPIDGTVNLLYGLPNYAVSVGAAVGSEFVAGCVVNVVTGDIYHAARGEGAFVLRDAHPHRLLSSRCEDTSVALVATGFSYDSSWRAKQAEMLRHILPRVRDIRRMGSAALDLCHLAEGRVDAYYEHATHPWDYAAAAVIASEAGCVVEHPGLEDRADVGAPVMAAAPRVWEQFKDLLDASGASRPLEAAPEGA